MGKCIKHLGKNSLAVLTKLKKVNLNLFLFIYASDGLHVSNTMTLAFRYLVFVFTASISLWSSFSREKSISNCTLGCWDVWEASIPHGQK